MSNLSISALSFSFLLPIPSVFHESVCRYTRNGILGSQMHEGQGKPGRSREPGELRHGEARLLSLELS